MAFCRTLAVGTTGGVVDGLLLAQGSEGGDGGIATAVVAAVAAVAGVLLTASATAYAARRKTAEIRLVYQQQLADRYLENARQYTNAIYVPLSTALSALRRALRAEEPSGARDDAEIRRARTGDVVLMRLQTALRAEEPGRVEDDTEIRRARTAHALREFLVTADRLSSRGADAFMTTELDERLGDFAEFLRRSLTVEEAETHSTLVVRGFGASVRSEASSPRLILLHGLVGAVAELGAFGLKVNREERVLAAPIGSRQFEENAVVGIAQLKALIKQVTLGTTSKA